MAEKIFCVYLAKDGVPYNEAYAALGRYYLAHETSVPEELYEYMDLGAIGCRYEDEHPGVFIGSDYVQYPSVEQRASMEMQMM